MSKSRKEILADIVASTQQHLDLAKSTGRIPPQPSYHVRDFDIQPLSLTSATFDFESQLTKINAPEPIATAAMAKAAEIASLYHKSYANSCQKLVSVPRLESRSSVQDDIENLRRTFEHVYIQKDLQEFLSKAIRAKALADSTNQGSRPLSIERKRYNHSFTPYLEAYFQQNAYPSAADRKSLAAKGGMSEYQIVVWFQNHRNRAKNNGTQLNRLSPSQAVDETLIEAKVKLTMADRNELDSDSESLNDYAAKDESPPRDELSLDRLASSSTSLISKTYDVHEIQPCVTSSEAFGLHLPSRVESSLPSTPCTSDKLDQLFIGFSIRSPVTPKSGLSKLKSAASQSSPFKAATRRNPFKATLRSCFSAAVTLTCPRSHPSFVRQKKARAFTTLANGASTILEQKRVAQQPYTLPAILPSWELSATPEPAPVGRRKKPTISSHAGKTRPGSPYPQQTLSRMSSASSLASMASDDSQSSSRSTSSTFSASTVESSEFDTPAQSPSPDNVELIDDVRFSDDIFGDYFFHSNPISDNFFFDINVEQPFDKDVSLSIAEFDKSVSLSIAEFETTTLPSFDFFES